MNRVICGHPEFLVQDANETNVSDNWAFSDGSPAETAWVRSSEYPHNANTSS